jgi:hypothetical protein
MAKFSNLLWGTPDKLQKLPTMSPEQQQLFNNLLQMIGGGGQLGQGYGQAMGGLQDYLDTSSQAYEKFADPYMRQFEQQTVPQLAERFAGTSPMGGGALSSSGFGQALSAASGNLQSELASMKTGLQRQAINDMMQQYQSMLGMGLGTQPFAYTYQPGSPGIVGGMAQSYGKAGFPGIGQGFSWLANLLTGGS